MNSEQIIILTLTAMILLVPTFFWRYFWVGKRNSVLVRKRLPFFDVLKGVAMLAVIAIHVRFFFQHNLESNNYYFLFVLNNLLRFAIPVFLICSGILLNPNSVKNLFSFFSTKFVRIFLPYIIIVVITLIYFGKPELIPKFLLNGRLETHLYFIIVLLQCYLVYPFLVAFGGNKKILLVSSFFISLLAFIYKPQLGGTMIPLVFQYLFFFVYGFVKRDDFLNYKQNRSGMFFWLFISGVYISLVIALPDIFYNIRLFWGLAFFNIAFGLRKYFDIKSKVFLSLAWFGRNSLWIYLFHFTLTFWVFILLRPFVLNHYYLGFVAVFVLSVLVSAVVGYVANVLCSRTILLLYRKLNLFH